MIQRKYYIVITAFAIVLFAGPKVFAALETASKKECAMCHVMWLDAFRSEKETLIQWQPGNVLMKDTQGIVSSEEMCYSCHDGYVLDSRQTAWKYNNHPVFKKPTDKAAGPEMLPLNNKDEIYCGTCHTPHSGPEGGGSESASDSIPKSISGPMSFLRMANGRSQMCEACHSGPADYRRTNGHPVHTAMKSPPQGLTDAGGRVGVPDGSVICQSCHKVHGASGSELTVMNNRRSGLCIACHKQSTILGTKHDFKNTEKVSAAITKRVSESGPCGACHAPHNAAGFQLWAGAVTEDASASGICLTCHFTGPDNSVTGIGKYSHPNDVAAVLKTDQQTGDELEDDEQRLFHRTGPVEKLKFHPVGGKQTNGKGSPTRTIQCFTCHDVHQWDPAVPGNRGGKDVEGTAANSFLRITAHRTSALCTACHDNRRPVLSTDHNLMITAPNATNVRGERPVESGVCGACHIPHNALDETLWAGKPEAGEKIQYCLGCHGETGIAKEKTVGDTGHPINVIAKGENMAAVETVQATLPLYTAGGGKTQGDRIACLTCHDAHVWSVQRSDGDVAGAREGTDPVKGRTEMDFEKPENIEGDAQNSFLRKTASPDPELCIVCHVNAALLSGTDHDLFVTAPASENSMGQTVKQSGPCGACHAVHNSLDKRLPWSRNLGPVAENQHTMNGLCTSCHQQGEIAQNKRPPAGTHPAGLLINNVMRFEGEPTGYVKLFNADWEEVQVADLSCSSCHSYYRWSYQKEEPGTGQNEEGTAVTSFLRTASDQAVCIDCHGDTALWRFAYYHSVEKREMMKTRKPQ